MACEYHVAAVGGSKDDEVSVDLADVLNTLGATKTGSSPPPCR